MENKQKFELSDATPEDQKAFSEGMEELLNKLSLGISLVINKKNVSIKGEDGKVENGFIDQAVLIIQKKTPIEDESIKKA